jgi:hypothetical protein
LILSSLGGMLQGEHQAPSHSILWGPVRPGREPSLFDPGTHGRMTGPVLWEPALSFELGCMIAYEHQAKVSYGSLKF